MIYSSFDYVNGFAPRFYRTPGEIKDDIDRVADEIDEINSVINIRHIISEYALGDGGDTPLDTRAAGMRELCESASSMLERLRELNCTLDELTRELIWTLSHT